MNGHTLYSIGGLPRRTGTTVKTIRSTPTADSYRPPTTTRPATASTAATPSHMTPELPDDPDTEQARAWVELAELSQDPDFRVLVRRLAEEQTAGFIQGGPPALHRDLAAIVRDQVTPVVAAGVEPASPQADPTVTALMDRCVHLLDCCDDGTSRRQLLVRLERMNDPRRERYLSLLAVINGWPEPESMRPVLDWAVHALQPRTQG
ncbi:hypothetical protein [Streptomyces sp. H62]